MTIKFTCSCAQPFTAPDHFAGRTMPCPKCGKALTVPASNPDPLHTAPPVKPAVVSKPSKRAAPPIDKVRLMVLGGMLLLILVVGGGIIAWDTISSKEPPPPIVGYRPPPRPTHLELTPPTDTRPYQIQTTDGEMEFWLPSSATPTNFDVSGQAGFFKRTSWTSGTVSANADPLYSGGKHFLNPVARMTVHEDHIVAITLNDYIDAVVLGDYYLLDSVQRDEGLKCRIAGCEALRVTVTFTRDKLIPEHVLAVKCSDYVLCFRYRGDWDGKDLQRFLTSLRRLKPKEFLPPQP